MTVSIGNEPPSGASRFAADWLGHSEMAELIRGFDWSSTPLGPLRDWPNSLRTAVAMCLHSRFPMAVLWGAELNFIPDDAAGEILGEVHPGVLGMPAREPLRDMWDVVGSQALGAMERGEAGGSVDRPLPLWRHGRVQTVYFTYSYSPIPDDSGSTGGVLVVAQETTARVVADARIEAFTELSRRTLHAATEGEACELVAEALSHPPDFEFAHVYLLDHDGGRAARVASKVAMASPPALDACVDMTAEDRIAPLFRELAGSPGTARVVEGIIDQQAEPGGVRVMAVATGRSSSEAANGFLVVGNRRLGSEDGTRRFIEIMALGIGTRVATYRAQEEQLLAERRAARERARAATVEEQYRQIFEATMDALVITDLDTGAIVEVNPAAERMLGYSYEELIGMLPITWIHPDYHHLVAEYQAAIADGREFRARSRQVRPNGEIYDVEVHGGAFQFRGRPHTLGVVRDISNEVATTNLLEQRVAERTEELASLLVLANQAAAIRELEQLVAVVRPEVEGMLACVWCTVYLRHDEYLVPVGEGTSHPLPDEWAMLQAGETVTVSGGLVPLFPAGVPVACSLVVPLETGGETIGVLCLSRPSGQPFGDEHRTLARGVADQLSVAISNARYFDAAQRSAALEERHRIARDLHDSVSQSLFSLSLQARTAELALTGAGLEAHAELAGALRGVTELTKGALAEMRALIFELRPGALAEEGLAAALSKHAAAVTAREGLAIEVSVPADRLPLEAEQEEHLYRLAQEALHNAVKHARADRARVELTSGDREIALAVSDDGVGFDPAHPRPGHLGLQTMRERAERIGGDFRLDSAPGAGTTVRVRIRAPGSG